MNLEDLKKKNNLYLSSVEIEINEHLPLIEDLSEVSLRTENDIASRLCAIAYVIGIGYDADKKELTRYLKKYNLWNYVSNYEKELLKTAVVSEQDKVNMMRLPESAQMLAWVLGLVEINHFNHCDNDLARKIPFKRDPSSFIENVKLRPLLKIQEQSDLLYRMLWYARNCRYEEKESILSESLIQERRKAIDWVYGVEENWDEVSTDT